MSLLSCRTRIGNIQPELQWSILNQIICVFEWLGKSESRLFNLLHSEAPLYAYLSHKHKKNTLKFVVTRSGHDTNWSDWGFIGEIYSVKIKKTIQRRFNSYY